MAYDNSKDQLKMTGFGNKTHNTNKQKITKNGPQLLESALRAHKTGDITNAEALYLNAINSGFHHEIAFSNLGVIYQNTGRKEQALAIYKRAVAKNPNFADAYTNLGNLYKDLGNLYEALASTLKSLELKPDNPNAHMNLGGIYKDLGSLDQALASTLKSLELKPDNPTALMNLGGIYQDLGNLDQALASTLKSLELKPDNPTVLMNLGIIYKHQGNLNQALTYTLKSLEINDKSASALNNLGDIYFEIGDFNKAEKAFNCRLKLASKNQENCSRGMAACYFMRKDYHQSIEILKSLSSDDNPLIDAYPKEAELKAVIDAKARIETIHMTTKECNISPSTKNANILYKTAYRPVEEDLIKELYNISQKKLSQLDKTVEARRGEGLTTDYKVFTRTSPNIQRLEIDLKRIIKETLGKDALSLKHDSFFNIFKRGAEAVPHNHLRMVDKRFNLHEHKYSLVYYLDVGDQDCEHPGILKMYEPEVNLLPKNGLILIIPAARMHSSFYEGSRDRLMLGVNFYAFSPNPHNQDNACGKTH